MKIACAFEDPVNDRYLAIPAIKLVCTRLGKPNVQVFSVTNPRTSGFDHLRQVAPDILKRYGREARAVVFVIDTDCEDGLAGRPNRAARLRSAIRGAAHRDRAVVVSAIQELEVWGLWGVRGQINAPWSDVRSHCDPKEAFFDPLITGQDRLRPDGGRSRLIKASVDTGWASLSSGCGELGDLQLALAPLIT
jgi:hypothetical protein